MRLEFLGADHEVTGSCHFLEYGGKRLLVDCGMEQGPDLYVNQEIPVNPAEIDYIFITHAHIDHSGLLPLVYAHGFRGQVFATKATCELCSIMLRDSAHIQMFEAEWKNRKGRRAGGPKVEPLYEMKDAEGVLQHFVSCEYEKKVSIDDNLDVRFIDAGHLLGSSSIEMWVREDGEEVKIAFSGDIGHSGKPLIKDPKFITEADYVVIESTYGDRNHTESPLTLVKQGINPISFPGLRMAITSDESREINFIEKPVVIISASGMCEAGRIRHHLKHNLWRKESTILFVGFQVPGTLGNMLLGGTKEVKLFGEMIHVQAEILNLPGISGHADKDHLTEWASKVKHPKKIFVVHGEDQVCDSFAAHLEKELSVSAAAPYSGDCYDLVTGEMIARGSRERAAKKKEKSKAAANIYARLLAAGQRLLALIHRCEGMPNKELGRFADQINSLCDKWER